MTPEWWTRPIAGGEDPAPEPDPEPEPAPAPEPEPAARPADEDDLRATLQAVLKRQEEQNALLGRVLEENQRLRQAGDADRLRQERYRPTIGRPAAAEGREDAVAQLEKVITEGLDEAERLAPTSKTLTKMLANAAPLIGQLVNDHIAHAEFRRQFNADFWTTLSDDPKWQGKTPRELEKRHGKRVEQLSRELMIDPRTGLTKPEYLGDPERAMRDLKDAYERELNMIAEDAPAPPRLRSRAATGDHGSARVQTRRAPESQAELDKTVSSVLEPTASRRR